MAHKESAKSEAETHESTEGPDGLLKPDIEIETSGPTQKWQASPEIRKAAEDCISGLFPLELRPSEATIEEFYRTACNLYKSGKYKEAVSFFNLLSTQNPKDPRYMLALGACMHMQKSYKDAVPAYTMASILDPDNPMPQYHLADCFIRMHESVGAYVALEMTLSRCKKNPSKYKGIMGRAQSMLSQLEKEFEEKKAQGITNFREGAEPPNLPPGIKKMMEE